MKGYIAAIETVAAARAANLSVGDYLEQLWHTCGSRQRVIDYLKKLGIFENCYKVVEIGPGSGMFLEKVLEVIQPHQYEIYEIAQDWVDYLTTEYEGKIIAQATNGKHFTSTPSETIDLVHAHGVFVYLDFLDSYSYFKEIVRVLKKGGFVVFDIFDETCFPDDIVEKWLNSPYTYPCFLGKEYVIEFFIKRGFSLLGNQDLYRTAEEGISHYLVFQKI